MEGSLNPRLILILLAEKQSHLIRDSMIFALFGPQPCGRDRQKLFSHIAAEWMSVCLSKRRLRLFFIGQYDDDFGTLHKFKQDLFITYRHTGFEGKNLMSFDAFVKSSGFFSVILQSVISSAPTNQRGET